MSKLPSFHAVKDLGELKEDQIYVEILQCKDCNKLAVSVSNGLAGRRLTNHKCSGQFRTVFAEGVDIEDIEISFALVRGA